MVMLAEVQYRTNVPGTNEGQREWTVVCKREKRLWDGERYAPANR